MNDMKFEEEYKKIFDNIKASDELKNKILVQKKPERRNFVPAVAALSSVAAAVVIVVSVGKFNFIPNSDGVISESSSVTSPAPAPPAIGTMSGELPPGSEENDGANHDIDEEPPKGENEEKPSREISGGEASKNKEKNNNAAREGGTGQNGAKKTTEEYKQEALAALERYEKNSSAKNGGAYNPPQNNSSQNSSQSVNPSAPSQGTAKSAPKTAAPTATAAPSEPDRSAQSKGSGVTTAGNTTSRAYRGVLLNVNAPSIKPEGDMTAMAALYDEASGEYVVEQWDNDRYFNYIGTDILNSVEYAEDLKYTGGASSYFTVDSSGKLLNDTMIFTFSGNNGRYAQIVTSRDLTNANTVILSENIVKSNINGTNAAVFAEGDAYNIYMIHKGTSYIINTSSLTEEEVIDILVSLTD